MLVIGLTGSLKTGKSTVAAMFKGCGARVVDVDAWVHRFLKRRGAAFKDVVRMFGQGILKSGEIDRKKLALIVFEDSRKLKKLERILHPRVKRALIEEVRRQKNNKRTQVLVVAVPLLFEAGLDRYVDYSIVVKARRGLQIQRATRQLNITKQEAKNRIEAQMPLSLKIRSADIIIDNNGNLTQTQKQVKNIWQKLSQRKKIKTRKSQRGKS